MDTVKLHIDTLCYAEKPIEFGTIKPRLQNNNTIVETELVSLIEKIEKGYSISPAVMHNGMRASNWSEQTLFMVDIDNDNAEQPILKVKDALTICNDNNIIPIFYYYTFSHTKQKPKYRLAFLFDKPIVDNNIRLDVINTLIKLFPQSDKSCTNADRVFLGTNKQVKVINLDARITIDNVLRLSNNIVASATPIHDKELAELKSSYDLLAYMSNENEVSHSTDDITYFKTCSICGHNDCLRYYHKSNSFYCFGANGNKGGSIIDYIMATEHLSLEQAINKFKNELCNIKIENTSHLFNYITANELQNKQLPNITFYVSKIIPQGLNLLCSVPKLGKSWFALQLCLAISTGSQFLNFNTTKSSCLYLALEDSENRLKGRTNILLQGKEAPSNLYFTTNSKTLNDGLIAELESFILEHSDVKVIVIDTLQKIREVNKSTNVYANDYKELSIIKSFADKYSLCIILIHHLRKAIETSDVFERVSGTNGITGTADTTLIMSKHKRSDDETKLSIVGRDVEFNDYMIKFNKDNCTWQMVNNLDDYHESHKKQIYSKDPLIVTIKYLVENNNGIWKGTLKELNEEHKKIYNCYYDNEIAISHALKRVSPLLLEYDYIEYIPASTPTKKGRVQTFRKLIQ